MREPCAAPVQAVLLEGVTGSGKTEVYFEAVAEALEPGGQALILMPEIALTAQFLDRFAGGSARRRPNGIRAVAAPPRTRLARRRGRARSRVVAGARSALFLPFKDLRLIVVDEEHEAAYKQEEGVIYHARDMAVVRARHGAAAPWCWPPPRHRSKPAKTPGRAATAMLRLQARFAGRDMPTIEADRSAQARRRRAANGCRRRSRRRSREMLSARRASAAVSQSARLCAADAVPRLRPRFQCPNCSAWLVEHRFRRALVCHHCGHVERRPDSARPAQADTLTACGPGVERLAEEAAELFPGGAAARAVVGHARRDRAHARANCRRSPNTRFDLVIGTQLVAKGHNFPHLTLVGVVDADIGLSTGDPRAAERTFQFLNQVAGRAGRGEKPGGALLQTWQPDHPVLRALLSGDFERFLREETDRARRARLPPFGRLAAVIVSGSDRNATEVYARALARAACLPPDGPGWSVAAPGALPGEDDIVVFGPAEAPIAMVRGKHRFRLLIKAPRKANIQAFLRAMRARGPKPMKDLKISVDVDPQSFL